MVTLTRDNKREGAHELTRAKKVQTPQQRRANEAFAKKQETKRGKNEPVVKKAVPQKSPVSKFWLCTFRSHTCILIWTGELIVIAVALLFVVCGGLVFELLRIIVGYF